MAKLDFVEELNDLCQRVDELQAENARLKSWFVSALLAGGGQLPKALLNIQIPVSDYIAHAVNQGLTIESEIGGGFSLRYQDQILESVENLITKIPPPTNQNASNL
jgi:hypothetical protein